MSIIFLTTIIVFSILYGQSKVVEEIGWGSIKHQSVSYNYDLTWGILVGSFGFVSRINLRLNCDFRKPLFDAEFDKSLVLNRVTFILALLSMSGPHFLKADIISPSSKVSSAEG